METAYISKVDKNISECMDMLSSRNVEYVEKLLDVRGKIKTQYGEHTPAINMNNVESARLIEDKSMLMLEKLVKYKEAKTTKKEDGLHHLKCFMEDLLEEFKCVDDMVDTDAERVIIKNKIKEIFALFN